MKVIIFFVAFTTIREYRLSSLPKLSQNRTGEKEKKKYKRKKKGQMKKTDTQQGLKRLQMTPKSNK